MFKIFNGEMLLKYVFVKCILQFAFVGCLQLDVNKSCPNHCQCDRMVKCFIFQSSQSITCPYQWKKSSIIVNFNLSVNAQVDRLFFNCSKSNITAIMFNMGTVQKITSSFLVDIIYLEKLIINGPGFVDQIDENLFENSIYLKTFKISGHNLMLVSKNLFHYCFNIQQLYLPNNRIKTIFDLSFRNCKNVKIIDLSRNQIEHIYKNTFLGLISLYKLILSHNKISYIEGQAFGSFENIHTIDLSYNNLLSIDIGAFFLIRNLFNLLLNNNHISVISIRAFKGLHKLDHLNLKNNNLKWLDELIFEEMIHLRALELDSAIDCVMKKKESKISDEVRSYLDQYPPCLKEIVTSTSTVTTVLTLKFRSTSSTYSAQNLKNYQNNNDRSTKVSDYILNKTCFNCTVSLSCASTNVWISFLAGVMTLSCFVLIVGFVIYVLITQRIIYNLRQYRANQDCLSMVTTNTRESNLFPQSKCEYKSINGIIDCDVAL